MAVRKTDIARIFNEVADLLEIQGKNRFRVRAYRNAARTVTDLSRSVFDMLEAGDDLAELPGIGDDLAGKIREIVESGTLGMLEELAGEAPRGLSDLMRVSGLGPKRVRALHRKLGITTLKGLRKAAEKGKVRQLDGFGEKTERNMLDELARLEGETGRTRLVVAEEVATDLEKFLKEVDGVKEVTVAGSYRRRMETVGDLDILAACKKGSKVMEKFTGHEDVDKVVSRGKTRSTVLLRTGLQVDLRVVPQVSYGAALHYFTGSKAHNIAVRKMGREKGLKINEYGVFKGKKRVAGKTEKEVYKKVNLPYIEPELRENRGEIEAARKGNLPTLITLDDIRGDLHAHTSETDGRNTLEEMAEAAAEQGYEYLAITDHTRRVSMARGLDAKRLAKLIGEIDRLIGKLKKIVILKSAEVDILEDGSLDLPDDILKELDLAVCAVHYHFKLSRKKQTERIIRAMDNRYFTILAHPSGRLINKRDPYEVDMQKIMEAAGERGCFLELNAHPYRLDLTDTDCKMAKKMKVKVAISTDAHGVAELRHMRFGIGQARRGWLEKADVINTRNLEELKKLFGNRK